MENDNKNELLNQFLADQTLSGTDAIVRDRLLRAAAIRNELTNRLNTLNEERQKLEAGLISANNHVEVLADLVIQIKSQPPAAQEDKATE